MKVLLDWAPCVEANDGPMVIKTRRTKLFAPWALLLLGVISSLLFS